METVRGQASVETITVFGISLLIVLAFMVTGLNMISDSARLQQENYAYQAAHDLSAGADEVFAQGDGAIKVVSIQLPQSTVFNSNYTYIGKPDSLSSNASVLSTTIAINYTAGAATATAQEPISGSFPSSQGIYKMKVMSHGNYVTIYPGLVEMSQYSVYQSMAQNETRQFTLYFYKISAEQVNVTISSAWSFSDVNFTISPVQFQADSGGTAATASINASSTAAGFYSSTLQVNATAYPSNISELVLLPVSVDVQG